MYAHRFYWTGGILLVLNLLIFLNRKHGFDYKNYASEKQLYNTNTSPTQNFAFTNEQLQQANRLLLDSLHIDTCRTDQEKLLVVNDFLYRSICTDHNFGPLSKTYEDPLTLFNALRSEKNLAFQCGEAAYLQAFFCSAIGLKTRPVQHIQKQDLNIPPDSHVYNEVWLSEKKQWVISDLFQNRHLLIQQGKLLSAVGLMDACLESDRTRLTVYLTDSGKLQQRMQIIQDPYFSKAYYLAFFKETSPTVVYNWKNKLRHYLLDYSHFSIYDPKGQRSNIRHRIKQIAFFGWLLWLSIFAVKLAKRIF